jgi:hypothetical protein
LIDLLVGFACARVGSILRRRSAARLPARRGRIVKEMGELLLPLSVVAGKRGEPAGQAGGSRGVRRDRFRWPCGYRGRGRRRVHRWGSRGNGWRLHERDRLDQHRRNGDGDGRQRRLFGGGRRIGPLGGLLRRGCGGNVLRGEDRRRGRERCGAVPPGGGRSCQGSLQRLPEARSPVSGHETIVRAAANGLLWDSRNRPPPGRSTEISPTSLERPRETRGVSARDRIP